MNNEMKFEFTACAEKLPEIRGRYVVIKNPKHIGEAFWNPDLKMWADSDGECSVTHWAKMPEEWPDMEPYTPEWFYNKMMACHDMDDTETAHWNADMVMCQLLTHLGFVDGVNVFNDMEKYYS